jgi:RNA polymerase sigma-70 factor (ECF subfamily)
MEDLQCYRDMRQGSKTAFEKLFRFYYAPLCRYAATFLHDPGQAEDIVQDCFFHFWRDKEKVSIHSSVKAYLYSLVRNACLNHLKHRQVEVRYGQRIREENASLEMASGVEEEAQRAEEENLFKKVHQAVEEMPAKRQEVFKMVKWERKSYQEVAHLLNISVKTVENQMGKALAYLRESLRDKYPLLAWLLLFSAGGIGVLWIWIVL